jgi:hypothetical protein
MDEKRSCQWCGHRIPKMVRHHARFCSTSCRQRAYERRLLEKQAQAKADAINAAQFPNWAGQENVPAYVAHLLVKPQLPLRYRPRRLKCPVCRFPFEVKKRGPIPVTCGDRCARALALRWAIKIALGDPQEHLRRDIVNNALSHGRRIRHQAMIDDMFVRMIPMGRLK